MAHLTLAGMSDDRRRLLLVDDSGREFTLDVDPALRAAVRGDTASLGQLEIHMDSALRPRDIQARIRSGETPEAVAQAAGTTVDRIMPYAAPVLAERAHIADRAQRASVRRRSGESSARTLADAVIAQLQPLNVSSDVVEWDASRREDGRWNLTADYAAGKHKGPAVFGFDAAGNYVVAENDSARWLVGESAERPGPARDDLATARERRRAAPSPADELPLGADALELVREQPVAEPQQEEDDSFLGGVFAAQNPPEHTSASSAGPVAEAGDAEDAADDTVAEDSVDAPAAEAADSDDEQGDEPTPSRRQVRKSRGRASVPSWDEIMFGGGKSD